MAEMDDGEETLCSLRDWWLEGIFNILCGGDRIWTN